MERPQVQLVASSLAPAPPPAAPPPRALPRRWPLLLAAAGVLLGLGARPPAAPAAPPGPAVELRVRADALQVSLSGVLVVPLELTNAGGRVEVVTAAVYASPVEQDPSVQAPRDVEAGAVRRFTATVAPDCRLLRPGSPLELSATVLVRVARGPVEQDLVVDLAANGVVATRVRALCA